MSIIDDLEAQLAYERVAEQFRAAKADGSLTPKLRQALTAARAAWRQQRPVPAGTVVTPATVGPPAAVETPAAVGAVEAGDI